MSKPVGESASNAAEKAVADKSLSLPPRQEVKRLTDIQPAAIDQVFRFFSDVILLVCQDSKYLPQRSKGNAGRAKPV